MIMILCGIVGFALLFLFDVFSMNQKNTVKYVAGLGGLFVIGINLIGIIHQEGIRFVSFEYTLIGIPLSVVSFALLFYSLFIEVGKKTYEFKSKPELVTTGTYALSRHPGVLWLLLFFVSLSFLLGNLLLLYTGLVWSAINILYVMIQEEVIFKKIFDDYSKYRKDTPMILPTLKSIKRCVNTLHGGEHGKLT